MKFVEANYLSELLEKARRGEKSIIFDFMKIAKFNFDLSEALIEDPEETLKAFLEAFNNHDLDAVMEFFAENCVMYLPIGPGPRGKKCISKEQIREGVANRFEGLPDCHYGDDQHWVSGKRGVSEWTLRGTTPSGERVEVRGTDHIEFDLMGKIVCKDSFWKIIQ